MRPGWGDFFLSKGYEVRDVVLDWEYAGYNPNVGKVYIVDQPVRGRSVFQAGVDGPQSTYDTFTIESRFTATQRFMLWPQARLHTQWPGNGSMGDAIFDSLYASTVPSLVSEDETSVRMKLAGPTLLDKIGKPVTLLTHSQSGPFGWILGDSRSDLVKSIVALEPSGPPFVNVIFPPVAPARPFGITETPVAYDPPVSSSSDLKAEVASNSSLFTCFQQASPARKLVNLMKVPILVVTSEASYHAVYDGCTVNYLRQAGVNVEHVNLGDIGVHGNAHMMFMERNNIEIAEMIQGWIAKTSTR